MSRLSRSRLKPRRQSVLEELEALVNIPVSTAPVHARPLAVKKTNAKVVHKSSVTARGPVSKPEVRTPSQSL
jgi:hypothetical protein